MAPEYAYTGQLTYKVDVFSFGVLAMEIVTGTPNVYPPADDLEYLTIVHRVTFIFLIAIIPFFLHMPNT